MRFMKTRELRSTIDGGGTLRLSLEDAELPPPGRDELVVEVRAAPVNPSDLRLLLGPVDPTTLRVVGEGDGAVVEGTVPPVALGSVSARLGQRVPVGNEGAGVVVAAGEDARHFVGRTVAFLTARGAYATHRVVSLRDCILFDDGVTPEQAASAFVNPLTALCMLQTLRREGHTALVHTAAASNLGQMLNRLCIAEDVPLVNIVRSAEQVALLRAQGARHVVDSSAGDFVPRLTDAVRASGATLAFDAVGGGRTASIILAAMERVGKETMSSYSAYGSPVRKQVFNYGLLDPAPRIVDLDVGTAWSIGGWLMVWELAKLDAVTVDAMKARVAREIRTTFASHYKGGFTLTGLLSVEVLRECMRRGTNRKYLVLPNGGNA